MKTEHFYDNFHDRNNNNYIIITDIPKYPRFIELLLLPLFNIKRFFFVVKYLMNKEYRKIKYYYHKDDDFTFLNNWMVRSEIRNALPKLFVINLIQIKKRN